MGIKKPRYSSEQKVWRQDYDMGVIIMSIDGRRKDQGYKDACWFYVVKCPEHNNVFIVGQNKLTQFERGSGLSGCKQCEQKRRKYRNPRAKGGNLDISLHIEKLVNGKWI